LENVSILTLNMESSQIARLTLHTPALPLTKLMTPPNLKASKLVRSLENLYKLTVTQAYICSEATRLRLALVKDVNPAQSPTPYYVVRVATQQWGVDAQLKLETIIYGEEDGKIRKIRGVTGYITLKILTPRATRTVDKLLALTTKLGLGKSRSIGFGEVETRIPRNSREA